MMLMHDSESTGCVVRQDLVLPANCTGNTVSLVQVNTSQNTFLEVEIEIV